MIKLTKTAMTLLETRYLERVDGKVVETPDDMFHRVARTIAKSEVYSDEWEGVFYNLLSSLDFLPNSPCLANAGKNNLAFSACYVLPIEDSIEGIFKSVGHAAKIHQSGGGTGFSFTNIRPKGDIVSTTGQYASGPVSFMKVFDTATGAIVQGGMRRGANMGVLRVDHPDILEFIECKSSGNMYNNFNISVGITDAFMDALGCPCTCSSGWNGDQELPKCVYNLQFNGKVRGHYCSHFIWDIIAKNAWMTGDPGVVFLDVINNGNANPITHWEIEATNPCGEQPLYPYDSCNLGSINLANFIIMKGDRKVVDWDRLGEVIPNCIRFLDDVIDVNNYPIVEIAEMTKSLRRIGLGVMGWADMLIKLNIAYASKDAVALARTLSTFIRNNADKASKEIALEKGEFPLYENSVYAEFCPGCTGGGYRNAARTTIAPTGTISLIAGCSSGIEPLFAVNYLHSGLGGKLKEEVITNPVVEEYLRNEVQDPMVIKTAHEIDPYWHLAHQAAWQSGVDNAVSKTINMKSSVSWQDIREVYEQAYYMGCKGVTVFRNGCKESQVLNEVGVSEYAYDGGDNSQSSDYFGFGTGDNGGGSTAQMGDREVGGKNVGVVKRPLALPGTTYQQYTPFGNMYVTIVNNDSNPFEVFATIGKAGSDVQAMAEGLGRVISKYLQYADKGDRVNVLDGVCRQLKGIGGGGGLGVKSIPDAISLVLERYLDEEGTAKRYEPPLSMVVDRERSGLLCLDCGSQEVYNEGGCITCQNCGWSRCG